MKGLLALLAGAILVASERPELEARRAPGPRDSWTTADGMAWDGERQKWIRPDWGKPTYPLRPTGFSQSLWLDGVPYDSNLSRTFQKWEREAYEKAQRK